MLIGSAIVPSGHGEKHLWFGRTYIPIAQEQPSSESVPDGGHVIQCYGPDERHVAQLKSHSS